MKRKKESGKEMERKGRALREQKEREENRERTERNAYHSLNFSFSSCFIPFSASAAMLPDARLVLVSRDKDSAIEKDLLAFEAKDPEVK